MKKLLLVFLLMTGTAGADTYRVGQSADSMKCTIIRSDNPNWNSGGRDDILLGTLSGALTDTLSGLVQPQVDPRAGGYTQDSLRLFFCRDSVVSDEPDTGDTLYISFFILKRAWGEGDKTSGAPAASGQATWDSSQNTVADWGTNGAKNTTSDREATAFDSLRFVASIGAGDTMSVKVPGSKVNDFFTYGAVMEMSTRKGTITFVTRVHSDDATTESLKPWAIGYETAPGGGGGTAPLSVGSTNLAAGAYGPNQ